MVSKNKRHPKQPIPANYYAPQPVPAFFPAPPILPAAPMVTTQALHDKNASVVNVQVAKRSAEQYYPALYEFKASGSSKREQGDVHDEEIGELIAAARAFQSLSRQLMSEATKRVNASTKAQWAAAERARQKREAAKKPIKRRSKAEWEKMQKHIEAAKKLDAELGGTIERAG